MGAAPRRTALIRRRRERRWVDWPGIAEGVFLGGFLTFVCTLVVWLAVHGAPGRY